MLALTQISLKLEVDLKVNMLGRWAVWPTMGALGLALVVDSWVPEVMLYVGLAMTLGATYLYLQRWRASFPRRTLKLDLIPTCRLAPPPPERT